MQGVPAPDWQAGFSEGQKLRARVLFVDPGSKRVGLTLLPRLVAADAALPDLPPVGTVYEASPPCCRRCLAVRICVVCRLWPRVS